MNYLVFVAAFIYGFLIKEIFKLKANLRISLNENLELATSQQLLTELRKRTNNLERPFVLLLPTGNDDYRSLIIESHGLKPDFLVSVLQTACFAGIQKLKEQGKIDAPDNEDFSENEN